VAFEFLSNGTDHIRPEMTLIRPIGSWRSRSAYPSALPGLNPRRSDGIKRPLSLPPNLGHWTYPPRRRHGRSTRHRWLPTLNSTLNAAARSGNGMALRRMLLTEIRRGEPSFPRRTAETEVRRWIPATTTVTTTPDGHETFTRHSQGSRTRPVCLVFRRRWQWRWRTISGRRPSLSLPFSPRLLD
jgi:hypothetical protein